MRIEIKLRWKLTSSDSDIARFKACLSYRVAPRVMLPITYLPAVIEAEVTTGTPHNDLVAID